MLVFGITPPLSAFSSPFGIIEPHYFSYYTHFPGILQVLRSDIHIRGRYNKYIIYAI